MGRKKQFRFDDLIYRENVLEAGKELYNQLKGSWHRSYFKNNNPITLELACGRGEYTTGLASVYPDRNFIGVDMKGDRLWMGSTVSLENSLMNTAFLRTHILDLDQFFELNEVDEIWIVFPDPRPRDRDEKRRLTNPRYLDLYKKILKQKITQITDQAILEHKDTNQSIP
jgi:tRNA (guanine-N7-)-methyltransferase